MVCRKLLSFIGPSPYLEAYYEYNGFRSKVSCKFIQEAFLEFFCNDWSENDQFVVFMTEESRKKNWLSKNECEEANFEYGLEKLLERLKKG